MVQNNVKPNIHTLNTVMEIVSNFTIIRAARDYAMKILVEFQGIGIGPSLATYFHLINVHYRSNNRMNFLINSNSFFTFESLLKCLFFLRGFARSRRHGQNNSRCGDGCSSSAGSITIFNHKDLRLNVLFVSRHRMWMTSSFSPEPWKSATTNWTLQTWPNVCTKSTCNRPIRYLPVICSCRPTFSEFQSTVKSVLDLMRKFLAIAAATSSCC